MRKGGERQLKGQNVRENISKKYEKMYQKNEPKGGRKWEERIMGKDVTSKERTR